MYNKALNGIFNLFVRWEKFNANCAANKYVSPQGVQNMLKDRLRHNELFRYQVFKGKFKGEFTQDKLKAAEEKIEANYKAGLIDSGKYQTQLYKIKSLRNLRYAESYSKWTLDKENLKYYKLKYTAQLGEDIERIAFNYQNRESVRKNGILTGVFNKRVRHFPDKPMI